MRPVAGGPVEFAMSGKGPSSHGQTAWVTDPGRLDDFARQYRPALTRYFRKRAAQKADVDDLVQEVFARLAVRGAPPAPVTSR